MKRIIRYILAHIIDWHTDRPLRRATKAARREERSSAERRLELDAWLQLGPDFEGYDVGGILRAMQREWGRMPTTKELCCRVRWLRIKGLIK